MEIVGVDHHLGVGLRYEDSSWGQIQGVAMTRVDQKGCGMSSAHLHEKRFETTPKPQTLNSQQTQVGVAQEVGAYGITRR